MISRSVLEQKCSILGELVPIEEEKKHLEPIEEQPKEIKIQRRPRVPVVESLEKCPCIIKGKKGEPDRICGRPVKTNERCGLHQKKCVLPMEEKLAVVETRPAVKETCPCIIKGKKGEFSGSITADTGMADHWYLALEAEPDVDAHVDVHTQPIAMATDPPKSIPFWLILIIVLVILLIGFAIYKYFFSKNPSAVLTATIPAVAALATPEVAIPVALATPVASALNLDFSDLPEI